MEFPKFPRSLEPAERAAVLEKFVRDAVDDFAREQPSGVSKAQREALEHETMMECRARWTIDRVRELETQLAGALKKIALLSRRLEEVTGDEE